MHATSYDGTGIKMSPNHESRCWEAVRICYQLYFMLTIASGHWLVNVQRETRNKLRYFECAR